ncbi:MAG: SPFH domain-containing protein [Myxococcaceae bacterium]
MGRPLLVTVVSLAALSGCATMDIPSAFRGQRFEHTGALKFYAGGKGFSGPILGPGTYYTGLYDELLVVDCSTMTQHDPLTVLTRDGVQFGLDIYVRFSANCTDESVAQILTTLTPERPTQYDAPAAVSNRKLFETYVRPAIGSVVREAVAPFRANEVNEHHEDILATIRKRFHEVIDSHEGDLVKIYEVTLSNLDFPEAMDVANVDRAVQSLLKDKAIAERDRVRAEIETATLRKDLAAAEGNAAAVKIDAVGAALKRNPDFLQYDLQQKMPGIYSDAGARGNLVIAAPQPMVQVSVKPSPVAPPPEPTPSSGAAPRRKTNVSDFPPPTP